MNHTVRGISCSLYHGAIGNLLQILSKEPFAFFIPWCSRIDHPKMLLPKSSPIYSISASDLAELSTDCIWELVLQMFPFGVSCEAIETYDDFLKSSCICCLIYYDCGLLDVYVKGPVFLERIRKHLIQLGAEDLEFLTDANDGRTALRV